MATQTSSLANIPAPSKGWNTSLPINAMSPQFATTLQNYIVEPDRVAQRPGAAVWARSVGGIASTAPVIGLMSYYLSSGGAPEVKLYSADPAGIRDITVAPTNPAVAIALTSFNPGVAINMTTSAGAYLLYLNGQDSPKRFDGTTWISITGAGTGAITGVTTTGLFNGCVYRRRLFLLEGNTLGFWYLPVDSIAGAAVYFNLGSIFTKAGVICACLNWTLDGGDGPDDYIVFVTTAGEVAVYFGSDPAVTADWSLQGVYDIGRPGGVSNATDFWISAARCLCKFGGDILFLCSAGLYPLGKALQSVAVDRSQAISDNIETALTSDMRNLVVNKNNSPLWSVVNLPGSSLIVVTGPTKNYVMHTQSKAWSSWVHSTATYCWFEYQGTQFQMPLFGTIRQVSRALNNSTTTDLTTNTSGLAVVTPYTHEWASAFTRFGSVQSQEIVELRPLILASPQSFAVDTMANNFSIGLSTDFQDTYNLQSYSCSPNVGGQPQCLWQTVACWPGYAASFKFTGSLSNPCATVLGVDLRLQPAET